MEKNYPVLRNFIPRKTLFRIFIIDFSRLDSERSASVLRFLKEIEDLSTVLGSLACRRPLTEDIGIIMKLTPYNALSFETHFLKPREGF